MILTDAEIKAAVESGELVIDGFEEDNLQPASYDLTVGPQGFSTSAKKLVNVQEAGYLLLKAGDYGLITTAEKLELPKNFVARFGLRSLYLRKGLVAAVGPQIDPGYRGRLILGLMNLSPSDIVLGYRDGLCTVEFHRLSVEPEKTYDGPYQDKLNISSGDIEPLVGSEGMAFSEVLTTLRSLSASVGALSSEMGVLKWLLGTGIAIIAIVLALKS